MHRIYIHCGLHKTGTSALQLALCRSRDRLRAHGILYPKTGCYPGVYEGHHNIALELMRDRRFVPKIGTLSDLEEEIRDYSGHVVLSSEGFASCLDRTEDTGRLADWADRINRELVFVVYLRNQVSYFESAYFESLKMGFGHECINLADEVLRHGQIRFNEWILHFEYDRIVRSLERIPGVKLVIRNYERLHEGSIVPDFMEVLKVSTKTCPVGDGALVNVRSGLGNSLSRFLNNRIGRRPLSDDTALLDRLDQGFDQIPVVLGSGLKNSFVKRFQRANIELCGRHSLSPEGLDFSEPQNDISRAPAILMERLFSFETQTALHQFNGEDGRTNDEPVDGLISWWSERINPTSRARQAVKDLFSLWGMGYRGSEAAELDHELAMVKMSRSWRWTAPLRWVSRHILRRG